MRTLETTILNPSGIHARPGALFVRTAAGFGSKITLENLDRESPAVDAKSILSVMQAAVGRGHRVRPQVLPRPAAERDFRRWA